MKVKTAKLTGAALDWAVAKAIGEYKPVPVPDYSTNWIHGGPIIEKERITVVCAEGNYSSKLRGYETYWVAESGHQCASAVYGSQGDNWGTSFQIDEDQISGPTPLIAAMRCYVEKALGKEVEIPEELK